jgi:hypothetical protein
MEAHTCHHTQILVAVSTTELIQCARMGPDTQIVELRFSYRYTKQHTWVVQAVNGFLSAYFMEQPGFRVQRHFDELESGMHVWLCEVPASMKMTQLLKRLRADIPPFRQTETRSLGDGRAQYVIDSAEPDSSA